MDCSKRMSHPILVFPSCSFYSHQKQIKQKLQADFMKLRADFQHISTLAKQRLAQATQASKAAAPSSASTRGGRFNADDEERSLLNDAVARYAMLAETFQFSLFACTGIA